jgi:hypothetical protein
LVYTDFLQGLGHDLRAVVDSEDDIGDAGGSESLDLVLDHGLVGELNKRLGVCEGLRLGQLRRFADRGALAAESTARGGGVQEASGGYQTLRRE